METTLSAAAVLSYFSIALKPVRSNGDLTQCSIMQQFIFRHI